MILTLIIFTFVVVLSVIILTLISMKSNNIDAVITYVNDQDPKWITERRQYTSGPDSQGDNSVNLTKYSCEDWRFRSSNELKYCLLGISKNCNWFRKIFIVVSSESQIPDVSYINECAHSLIRNKIEFICHHQFFKDKTHLPTFNSMSIEANLCFIPELSEKFVYFNDDCFINSPIKPYFFIENNKINVYPDRVAPVSERGTPQVSDSSFIAAWKNTNNMLDTLFPMSRDSIRKVIQHIPQIQLKSVHLELHNLFPKEFEMTSSSRFRNTDCHLTTAGLAEYYSLYKEFARIKENPDYIQVYLNDNENCNYNKIEYIAEHNFTFINIQNNRKQGNIVEYLIELFD